MTGWEEQPSTLAGLLVYMGLCDGNCLLALHDDCSCVCLGRYHGALFDTEIGFDINDYAGRELERIKDGVMKAQACPALMT